MLSKHTTDLPRGQAGFTLIELSIVLVIIGLLIGGILKGQEMIQSTRVKTQVAQVDALRAAVNSFQDRYLGLPGDLTGGAGLTDATTDGTSDDGKIGTTVASNAAIAKTETGEPSIALTQLSESGFIGGIRNPKATDGTSILNGKMTGAGVALGSVTVPSGTTTNVARVAGDNGYGATAVIGAATASQIDAKYDDGIPDTGSIQDSGAASCSAASKYKTTDGSDCFLQFTLQ